MRPIISCPRHIIDERLMIEDLTNIAFEQSVSHPFFHINDDCPGFKLFDWSIGGER
jgi:hypothetical protein